MMLGLLAPTTCRAVDESPADSILTHVETEHHLLATATESVVLAHPFIAPTSFRATVNGQLWQQGRDYQLRSRDGIWIPLRPLGEIGGTAALVILSYRFQPAPLIPRAALHPVLLLPPTVQDLSGPESRPQAEPAAGGAVGNLTVHGSKSVQVSSGNRREVTVDQNLRLFISGQLTRDISVKAVLTDDNLPVVPEGNTEELQDIDQVLIQLEASQWEATLGDFVAARRGRIYGNYRRKMEGFSLAAWPGAVGAEVLAGSPRGIYQTLQIRGEEANQGPYRLGFGDVGDELFIVAGSEKVSLDGERLTRGADRDYVIDYVRGTITFTYRRLITAESTIVVEFEQGEGPFARSVVGGGGQATAKLPLGDGLDWELGVRLLQENDDPEQLRTGELSDEDLAILADAGDDPRRAVADGILEVAIGEGQYRQTTVDSLFIYVYDDTTGQYILDFFYLGPGRGDYGVDSLTVTGVRVFSYRGENEGSYRIGRPLPLPAKHELVTLSTFFGSAERPRLSAEWNISNRDLNQLSDLDNEDDEGQAWAVAADLGEGELRLGQLGFGQFTLKGRHQYRENNFRPFLLHKDRFAYDRWGLGERASQSGFLEQRDAESVVEGRWRLGAENRFLKLTGQWGRLEHGEALTAERAAADVTWKWLGGEGRSDWERAVSEDSVDPLDITRQHQRHFVQWNMFVARPSAFYEDDQWQDEVTSVTGPAGYRLRRWGAGLASLRASSWSWQLNMSRGLADSLRNAVWETERDSRTGNLGIATSQFVGMRLVGDVTLRNVVFRNRPDQTNRLAKLNLNGQWRRFGSDWNVTYSVDNSRSEILNRQIVPVGERQGDYNEVGDFVGRNLGDFTVVYSGTDSLVITTTVRADLNWRQDFGFLGRERIWGAWTSLTNLAITGQSRTDDVASLLKLEQESLFDEENTVLGAVSLKQEFTLLRHLRWLDLRLRYDYDKSMDRQFATNPEDRLRRHLQGTTTWSTTEKTSMRLRASRTEEKRETVGSMIVTQRSYDAVTRAFDTEWTWRPTTGSRYTLTSEFILRNDAFSGVEQLEWAVRPTTRFRLAEKWSAQAEFRWARVGNKGSSEALQPFFFSLPGRNLLASARLDWDPTKFLNVALFYFGRLQGEGGWQHDIRLESTARF